MPVPRLPLVVTADPDLLDDLLRLAAAGGAEVTVAADPVAARSRWAAAPLVLIGADQVGACVRARLPRHRRAVVVARREWPPGIDAAAERLGSMHVCVLPDGETWLVNTFAAPPAAPPAARTVAVIGGRGGAGASILAGGLAVTAVRAGHRTLLLDADPLGGGLDLLLGWEQLDGLRWPALAETVRVDPPALLRALPHRGDLMLLSFARDDSLVVPAAAMASAIDAGLRARDVIIADLPRQLDDAAVIALGAADRALLIVPAELRAVTSASRVARIVRLHCDDLAVVVRGPAPGKLVPKEIARVLELPLAGSLRPEPAMCAGLERGVAPADSGRGELARLCRELIGDLVGAGRAEAAA